MGSEISQIQQVADLGSQVISTAQTLQQTTNAIQSEISGYDCTGNLNNLQSQATNLVQGIQQAQIAFSQNEDSINIKIKAMQAQINQYNANYAAAVIQYNQMVVQVQQQQAIQKQLQDQQPILQAEIAKLQEQLDFIKANPKECSQDVTVIGMGVLAGIAVVSGIPHYLKEK